MPELSDMPVKGTGDRIGGTGVKEPADSGEIFVQDAFLSESSFAFEDFLAALSVAMSDVEPQCIQHEIARWLDRLAQQLGVEQCAVGEFNETEKQPRFLMRWTVGNQPATFVPKSTSWMHNSPAGPVTSISGHDEHHVESVETQPILEALEMRLGVWIPMRVDGAVVGGIGLAMLSQNRVWRKLVIQRCQLVADVLGNTLVRCRKIEEIKERSQFEALITDFSTRFMNDDTGIDAAIDEVLSELGDFLDTDRVSYLEFDASKLSLVPTWQWFAQGVEQDHSVLNTDVSNRFPWLREKIIANEPVVINDLDQFPDEATNERQYCESLGIQAIAMVPTTLGGVAVAALTLDNFDTPRFWSDEIAQRLQIVTGIIAGALRRARQEHELDELNRFERVVSDISTALVNLPPEDVNDQIESGLGLIAAALDADLATLLQPRADTGYEVTHEWVSDGVGEVAFKGSRIEEDFPWLADRLDENEVIAISELSEFPALAQIERAAMERMGLESVLWVPFEIRGKLAGYLAIDTIRQRTWSNELVLRLKLLGEVFGEALSRRNSELGLRDSFREINALKDQLRQENLYLREEAKLTYKHGEIVGDSPALRATLAKVEQVASTDSTVLILGETGTGKELLARTIHNISGRKDQLMVKVNCASLPASLVEAELFGREKGAYTGSLSREPGRFEIADGSTILLDEIGELPLELQAKLLRVLQDGEFERLGSSKTLKVDVRVLAATNRDLVKAVEKKEFREDLYYRLNVFPIDVPPLRDRLDDIPKLVWHFVQEFSESMGKSIESISVGTMDALKAYRWPGNIREVRNVIERAMILSTESTLNVEMPSDVRTPGGSAVSSSKLADVEREHIRTVVESTAWRVRGSGGAAEILGLKPTTLEARMKKLGLQRSN